MKGKREREREMKTKSKTKMMMDHEAIRMCYIQYIALVWGYWW